MSQAPLIFNHPKPVFISHATSDDKFVTRLAADLRKSNIPTWVDHENIFSGMDWDQAVETALKASIAMIVVLSPDAIASDNVRDEWNFFREEHKAIHPINLITCEIPFRLRRPQRIDFSQDYESALQLLLRGIRELYLA